MQLVEIDKRLSLSMLMLNRFAVALQSSDVESGHGSVGVDAGLGTLCNPNTIWNHFAGAL